MLDASRSMGWVVACLATMTWVADVSLAGGAQRVDEEGVPYVWSSSTPVIYFLDQGELGTLSNEVANAAVRRAFKLWQDVPEASIRFSFGGQVPEDIDGQNFGTLVYNPIGSGINLIIYDDDGSIIAQEIGEGAEHDVLGLTSIPLVFENPNRITQALVILNGLCFDGDGFPVGGDDPQDAFKCEVTLEEIQGAINHEIGHFAGLGHTDLNRQIADNNTFTNQLALPTMYPLSTDEDTTVRPLHLDDRMALARLYPAPDNPGGVIQGRIFRSDGTTPVNGANVTLRRIDDPFRLSMSDVSGDLRPPGAITRDGYYRFQGLTPGHYTVRVDPLPEILSFGSSVGQWGRCTNVDNFDDTTNYDVACQCIPADDNPCTVDVCPGSITIEGECEDCGFCDEFIPPNIGAAAEYLSDNESATDRVGERRLIRIERIDDGSGQPQFTEITTGADIILNDITAIPNDYSGTNNNSFATATPISGVAYSTEEFVVEDRIEVGDVDYYRFFVPAGWCPVIDVDARDASIREPMTGLEAIVQLQDKDQELIEPTLMPNPATGLDEGEDPTFFFNQGGRGSSEFVVAISSAEDTSFTGAMTGSGAYYLRISQHGAATTTGGSLAGLGGRSANPEVIVHGLVPSSLGAVSAGMTFNSVPILPPRVPIDSDGDGITDEADNCQGFLDPDEDGACEEDNCPNIANQDQADGNADGQGDLCDNPAIVWTLPFRGSVRVPLHSTVRIRFSEAMDRPSLLIQDAFQLVETSSGMPVPFQLSISGDDKSVTLDPEASLATSTSYTVLVDRGPQEVLMDTQGELFGDQSNDQFSFTTAEAPTPDVSTDDIGNDIEGSQTVNTEDGRFGASIAAGIDVNGDGFPDAVVGDPMANGGAGLIRITFGGPLAVSGEPPTLVIQGTNAGDRAGAAVAMMPDHDGDGNGEVLVGAPGAASHDGIASRPGAAYLIRGEDYWLSSAGVPIEGEGPFVLDQLLDQNDCEVCAIKFEGESDGDQAGHSLSFAGDFNGDGERDLMIGAPNADPLGRVDAGIVYVTFGFHDSIAWSLGDIGVSESAMGTKVFGARAGDRAGFAVSDWRDLTNDAFDDVLIGAPEADVTRLDSTEIVDAGIAYALMGQSDPAPVIDLGDVGFDAVNAPGIRFNGDEEGGNVGYSVWGRGDVTGDGERDILIGAPGANFVGDVATGEVYLLPSLRFDDPIKRAKDAAVDMSPKGPVSTPEPIGDRKGTTMQGMPGDQAGFSVATAGDLDRDGLDEILIGAPGHDSLIPGARGTTMVDTGQIYLLFGQTSRPETEDLSTTAVSLSGLMLEGVTPNGRLGEALTGMSDIDSSGSPDLIIGAPGNDNSSSNGECFITEIVVARPITDLSAALPNPGRLTWSRIPGATEYVVYRGELGNYATDIECIHSGPLSTDTENNPYLDLVDPALSPGEGLWYIVAGENGLGLGAFIKNSEGLPRLEVAPTCAP